jgi:hypothetical protein
MTNTKETIIMITLGIISMVMWWGYYVVPADAFRDKVMECMSERGDMSEENYNICVSLVAPERP